MPRPATKTELLERMESEMQRLLDEVTSLDARDRTSSGACEDWSVKDLLAHLDAWHAMFLNWQEEGSAGKKPVMPAQGYSWSETPALNQEIWERTKGDDFEDVVDRFRSSYEAVRNVIESYDPEDLFTKKRYAWTGSTSVGSYAVSATSSHYEWARKLVARYKKALG